MIWRKNFSVRVNFWLFYVQSETVRTLFSNLKMLISLNFSVNSTETEKFFSKNNDFTKFLWFSAYAAHFHSYECDIKNVTKNISSNQLFSKCIAFTKFLPIKQLRVNFRNFRDVIRLIPNVEMFFHLDFTWNQLPFCQCFVRMQSAM